MAEITPERMGLKDRVTIRRSEARDFRVYEAMVKEAERRGLPLEIIDDTPAPAKPEADPDEVITTGDGTRLYVTTIDGHASYTAARAKAAELDAELIIR